MGLSQHLRHCKDEPHQKLKAEWHEWRKQYRATLYCRKCGSLFEVTDKKKAHLKRCPSCEEKKQSMSKRDYEDWRPEKKPDPRVPQTARASKAAWTPRTTYVKWEPGGPLYQEVLRRIQEGEGIVKLKDELGITYKVLKAIAVHGMGDGFNKLMRERDAEQGRKVIKLAHEWWNNLSSEEKAQICKQRFGGTCQLETTFAEQMRQEGLVNFKMNDWQSIPIDGKKKPREADIKLDLGDGRKVVILCDGEAFHGPKVIYGSADKRVEDDVKTARAYFDLGYTTLRYSESEIHAGEAIIHLKGVVSRLSGVQKILRTWWPNEEIVV